MEIVIYANRIGLEVTVFIFGLLVGFGLCAIMDAIRWSKG